MPKVVFLPWEKECWADAEDTLLEAALEADIPLPHACGGDASCSTCAVEILSGAERLSPMEPLEQETLGKLLPARAPSTRLSCQARILAIPDRSIRVRSLRGEIVV